MDKTTGGQGYRQLEDGTWEREPTGAPACPYCKTADPQWMPDELRRGKRALRPGPGVEYHCMLAFYGAQ